MVDFSGKGDISRELTISNRPLILIVLLVMRLARWQEYSTYKTVATCHTQTFAQYLTYCRMHSGATERKFAKRKEKIRTSHSLSSFGFPQTSGRGVLGYVCCYSSRRRNRDDPLIINQSLFKRRQTETWREIYCPLLVWMCNDRWLDTLCLDVNYKSIN